MTVVWWLTKGSHYYVMHQGKQIEHDAGMQFIQLPPAGCSHIWTNAPQDISMAWHQQYITAADTHSCKIYMQTKQNLFDSDTYIPQDNDINCRMIWLTVQLEHKTRMTSWSSLNLNHVCRFQTVEHICSPVQCMIWLKLLQQCLLSQTWHLLSKASPFCKPLDWSGPA